MKAINSRYEGAAHDAFIWQQSKERSFLESSFSNGENRNSWLLGMR